MNEPSLNELSFIDHFSGKSETQREEKSYLRTVLANHESLNNTIFL